MSEHERIKQLSEKMARLLDAVGKNGGRFSSIDKDLLTNYVRELYELSVGIHPQAPSTNFSSHENHGAKNPVHTNGEEVKPKEEKQVNGNGNGTDIFSTPTEIPPKKTISEIYAGKNENGKSTVNDKFKKQGLEIADKLKQTPIKDLKSYIGLNKQFAFMSKLFNADEQLYEDAIAKLNTFRSYEEATGYIQDELLPSLHWSDEEPLVSEFFMLVMRRYLN